MTNFRRHFFSLFILCSISCSTTLYAQPKLQSLASSDGQLWTIKPQNEVKDPVLAVCTPGYVTNDWVKAIVPGTVFGSFVAAGLEKDPNFGDNIHQVNRAKYDRNWWYRTELKVPADFTKEKIWLHCKGINRKADIYLNGILLGKLDGFMHRGQFDISDVVQKDKPNVLAILVYWPQPPMANQASPTYIASAGWDWIPYVPGLNMGITDKVYLSNTGKVTIHDPWVRTSLPSNARADLSVAVELVNNGEQAVQGMLKGTIQPGNIAFEQKVTINPNTREAVTLGTRYFPQLAIHSPRLWWPNGMGEPNLYECSLRFEVNGQESDVQQLKFGIKKYTYDTVDRVLHVYINGSRVFLKGGNWGMSEYMLRCRGAEYDTKLRLHREMNFNIIRNWIGHTTDEEFYEACDKYGIMVWDDFWLNSNANLPRDLNVFNANVIEKIKRFRNHPSIAIWCGDNEGWPEPPLSNWLKEDIRIFDGGERYFQANSHDDNLTGSGPWGAFDPRYYFTYYPKAIGGNRGWGMRSEIGTAVFTNFESFKKFIPQDKWWPRNDMWNIHYFGPNAFNATPDAYEKAITERYGKPAGIEDFCRKAQFLNIESNKGMYEGWLDHMWEDASGIMTWMSQSAYPSLVWQTYDYYYDCTGAYWGVKKACEPLHIQWNPVTDAIKVVNTTTGNMQRLQASAAVYNLNGKQVAAYNGSATVDAPANSAVHCFYMPFSQKKTDLALNRPVVVSGTSCGSPAQVADGKGDTRWCAQNADDQWIYIDLGEQKTVGGVQLNWEDAYAKAYKIQVSSDAIHWKVVYETVEGRPGIQDITFTELPARYVRMQGVERGTWWAFSLWDFKVFEGNVKSEGLSDVHFMKLQLKDETGKIVSDNFYWRGHQRQNFTALNTLPKVSLKTTYKVQQDANGIYHLTAQISNPSQSSAIAFGIRVQAVRAATGEQILPSIMSDNYFSLLPGEQKEVRIEFNAAALGGDKPELKVEAYNNTHSY